MYRYQEVMKCMIEVAESGQEGLNHVLHRLGQGDFEETFSVLNDVMEVFSSVEQRLNLFIDNIEGQKIEENADRLRDAFQTMVCYCEAGDREKMAEVIQRQVAPFYQEWRAELFRCFQSYVIV